MNSSEQLVPFRQNRFLKICAVWLVIVWIITAIKPYDRFDWALENLLVIITGLVAVLTYNRFAFSNASYGLFTVFLTMHMIGAHYTYAETPFGFWLQAWFEFDRNHYDRIVHFGYGLLLAYPFYELMKRTIPNIQNSWAYFLTASQILAMSGLYEVIEAIVAIIVSPELGDAYLGTQGDIWDAQSDMFLAFVGAIIAMIVTSRLKKSY